MIVASGLESDRHVFGLVPIDDQQAFEQDPVGIECGIDSPVGTDVTGGRGAGQLQLLLDGVQHPPLSSNVGGPFNIMLSRGHRSREHSDGMDDVPDRVVGLEQIRQYDVSCEDIGQNLSSADSTLINRRENARFCLRKRI